MSSQLQTDRDLPGPEAAVRFLLGRIDYERARNVPYRQREFKLERMRELLDGLGNPQSGLPIVHVAGTKGKGSTAAMIAAVLSAAGQRIGVFSSPHLDRIEERMSVDGCCCPADEFAEMVDQLRPVVETMDRAAAEIADDEIGPTYFELTTAMALMHFARSEVDTAILEVGLGGRLDSTNVCEPRVSVITSISLDHTRQLGNTLESIAREKAGIVKPGVPVVSGVRRDEPREVIREVCRRQGSRLVELGVDFDFDYYPPRHLEEAPAAGKLDFRFFRPLADREDPYPTTGLKDLSLRMLGRHQAANAAVALAVLAELSHGGRAIPEEAIRTGLATVGCPARVEVVARRPAIVLDAAHNRASIEALLKVLDESFSAARRLLVFATSDDKDFRGMLSCLMDRFDEVIFTRYLKNPRAVSPQQLQQLAAELTGRPSTVAAEPAGALEEIRRRAAPDDLICITGSFFLAAEIRRLLAVESSPQPTRQAER